MARPTSDGGKFESSCNNVLLVDRPQLAVIALAKFLYLIIYNLYFHPLRLFPGPKSAAATPIPFAWRMLDGNMVRWTTLLHEEYGEVVRIHPDELSFIGSSAYQDIYNSRPQFPKPEKGTLVSPNGVRPLPTITNIDDHNRQRRILSHAFSDRALREQEYLLQKYSDLLVDRLRDQVEQGQSTVDICEWYNFATFDIIGDLCFGQSFHCLETADNHPWIAAIYSAPKFGKMLTAFQHFPPMYPIIRWALPRSIRDRMRHSFDWTQQRITERIEQKSDRPDFIKYVLEHNNKQGMTRDEIDSTISVVVLAGSGDTTSTALASATYFVLKNPGVMSRLQKEIRDAMQDDPKNVTVAAVSGLPFLHAVLQEGMRLHPAIPFHVPRVVDRPGVTICGMPVPQGYRVGIPAKTAYRLPSKWMDSHLFLPERWLSDADPRYANDDRAIFEPFMVGPRNCIGKNLAWAEMKLVLAKLIWSFDLELSEKNQGDWTDQKVYFLNEKLPMYVTLQPRA